MKLPSILIDRLKAKAPGLLVVNLTTSSRDGKANVLPIPFSDVVGDELVLLPDLFAQKTRVNLNENRQATLSFASDGEPVDYVLEGRADVIQWGHPPKFKLFGLSAGEVLERWGDWDEKVEPVVEADESVRPSVFAQRGVIVFKPERITEGEA